MQTEIVHEENDMRSLIIRREGKPNQHITFWSDDEALQIINALQQSFAPDAPPESCEHGNFRGKCPVEICSYSKHGGRR